MSKLSKKKQFLKWFKQYGRKIGRIDETDEAAEAIIERAICGIVITERQLTHMNWRSYLRGRRDEKYKDIDPEEFGKLVPISKEGEIR